LIAAETSQWYQTLTEADRRQCEAELTDAYFAALTDGQWDALRTLVQRWCVRAEEQQLVTA
jgi:hypothetical protein